MKLGVRAKLFVVTVLLILVGGGAAGFWLQGELALYLEIQARTDLEHAAQTARVVLLDVPGPLTTEAADRITDRLAPAADVRFTVIAADGSVLGDSEFSGLALSELDSHGERPEIVQARRDGVGSSGRFSRSVETEMMYVAVCDPASPGSITVRASRRLSSLRSALGRMRLLLAGAAGLLTVIATLMSAMASWFMARAVHRLLHAAGAIRANRAERIDRAAVGDFAGVADSVNQVLDDLQGTMNALESQNHRMEAVLQGMSEPVLALDAQQVITLTNRAVVDVLGLSEDPVGRSLHEVLPALKDAGLVFDGAEAAPQSVEFELGHQRLLAQTTPQRDNSGSVLVVHDITGIRRLEKMRRDFVANVSHELRTPVAVLQANSETLLDGALDDRAMAEKLVEAIHRQTERLANLVGDLLDISRIEAGQYRLEREAVAVSELCAHSLEAMERPAASRKTRLHLAVPEGLFVVGDGKAAEQIVTNLLDNAIKYGHPGGNVTLRAIDDGARIHFEVEDDGPGIDRKHHARLFERFYRVDKGRSRGMGGTGLGLSIVKHLVESMEGRLGYRAARRRGSVFWFELPRATLPIETAPRSAALAPEELQ